MESLYDLTGKDSGVISYDAGATWLRVNWASQFDTPSLPRLLGPMVVWMPATWEARPCTDPAIMRAAVDAIHACEHDDGVAEEDLSPAAAVCGWELTASAGERVYVAISQAWI